MAEAEVEGMNSLAELDSEDFLARDRIDESLLVQDKFDKFGNTELYSQDMNTRFI